MNIAEKIADLAVKAILGQSAYANYQSGALPKKELQIYADGIQVLSKNYTEHQVEKQFKNKISDKVLAESYALYYAPVNSAKLCDIFQKTPALLTQRDQLKVLDYGAGPGTATLTLLFLTDIPIHITCIEHSPEMREIAESLFSELSKIRKDFTWRILNQLPQSLDADFDFIFLMNVLNELGLSESTKFLSTLKSLMNDGTKLAIVEPA